MTVTAFLGLGSNLGDRFANLARAVELLESVPIDVLQASSVYESAPSGPPQPDYFNAALKIGTDRTPHDLLRTCRHIEDAMGRDRNTERWGPRIIDIDILLYGDLCLETPDLMVPHPEMMKRSFVLVPLLELDAGLVHPSSRVPLSEGLVEAERMSGGAIRTGELRRG